MDRDSVEVLGRRKHCNVQMLFAVFRNALIKVCSYSAWAKAEIKENFTVINLTDMLFQFLLEQHVLPVPVASTAKRTEAADFIDSSFIATHKIGNKCWL